MIKPAPCLYILSGIGACLCPPSMPAKAQERAPSFDEQKAAMARLDSMVGQWKGDGWIKFGPRRFEFESCEVFAKKAGGLAIMVEGLHHMILPNGQKRVIHNAAAMITFNAETKRYRFASQLANGRAGDYEATFTENGQFQWVIPDTPMGKMVYTISVGKDGTYHEIGELVTGSGERTQFFEMNLTKLEAAE